MNIKPLTDAQWAKIAPLCLGKNSDIGRTAVDNRLFIDAILWIVHTGGPWRDLPAEFGNWNSQFKRYRRWVKAGVFSHIFAELRDDFDFEYTRVEGGIVKVHSRGQKENGGLLLSLLGIEKTE